MSDNARLHDHEKLIAADEIGNIKHLHFQTDVLLHKDFSLALQKAVGVL